MPATTASKRPNHILVLDGAQEVLDLFRDLLEGEGYRVSLSVTDGTDRDLIQRLRPDLIVLDLLIGGGNGGRRLLQRVKRDPRTSAIPVIVCTGAVRLLRDDLDRLAEEGVRVIEKPFDIDDLLRAIANALAGRKRAPDPGKIEPNGGVAAGGMWPGECWPTPDVRPQAPLVGGMPGSP